MWFNWVVGNLDGAVGGSKGTQFEIGSKERGLLRQTHLTTTNYVISATATHQSLPNLITSLILIKSRSSNLIAQFLTEGNEVRVIKRVHSIPLAWIIFKWSTVIWRISAFSSLAEPCFSKAVGTRRRSSERLLLMRSRRRFSITPRRFFLLKPW